MDRIRKLKNERRETKAANMNKKILLTTMKNDVDKVEQLRLEKGKMAQE